jgi:hypothetical protein
MKRKQRRIVFLESRASATYPEGFEIVMYRLGEDHWTEGYFTRVIPAQELLYKNTTHHPFRCGNNSLNAAEDDDRINS